jgi:hypothetical protein
MIGQLLRDAWRMTWTHKRLWWHAIAASLLVGAGIGTAVMQILGVDPAFALLGTSGGSETQEIADIITSVRANPSVTSWIVVVLTFLIPTALLALLIGYAVKGTNAVIAAAYRIHQKKEVPSQLWNTTRTHAWPTFVIHLLSKILIAVVLLIWLQALTLFAISPADGTLPAVAAFIGFFVAFLILLIINCTAPFAIILTVIDGLSFPQAIREALALFRERTVETLLASLAFSATSIVAYLAWVVSQVALTIPILFIFMIGYAQDSSALAYSGIRIAPIVGALVTLPILAMYGMFLMSAWTLLTLQLSDTQGDSTNRT